MTYTVITKSGTLARFSNRKDAEAFAKKLNGWILGRRLTRS